MARTLMNRRSLGILSVAIVVSLASWPGVALAEGGALESVAGDTVEVTEQVAGVGSEALGGAADDAAGAIEVATHDATEAVGGAADDAAGVVEVATQEATVAAGAVEEVVEGATDAAGGAANDPAGAVARATQDTSDAAIGTTQRVTDTATDTTQQISGAAHAASEEVAGTESDATGAVTGPVDNAGVVTGSIDTAVQASGTTNAGVQIVEGFRSEVVGSSDAAVDATGVSYSPSGDVSVTDVSTMATALTPVFDPPADEVGSMADGWSRPTAAEVLSVRYAGASVAVACTTACDMSPSWMQRIVGQDDSFTDQVISTIRSLAATGLTLLFKMWSILVLALLGAVLIGMSRRQRPLESWVPC